jgi:hypothetical protein|nr:hypothetical protein [uncultured Ruminococcus sp.]
MRTTTNEKLEKVILDIENTKSEIEKSKEKIKKLNALKKKLELQIEKEKHNELCSVLSDYGIKSVNDFQDFLEKYTSEASADENANGEN